MRGAINPYGVIGFALASAFAVGRKWSLQEFCWGTWMAGLVYAWTCIFTASLQIVFTAHAFKTAWATHVPFIRRLSPTLFFTALTAISLCTGLLAFRLYSFLFAFYGMFLSFFAEMEPRALFGRDGFINSDFFTPLLYLVNHFWPFAAGVLIANWEDFFRKNPWKRILVPAQTEVVRIHMMILALPFFSLIAWALFGEAYQSAAIVLLMGLFYFSPKKLRKKELRSKGESA
jgi:hypothetical protein